MIYECNRCYRPIRDGDTVINVDADQIHATCIRYGEAVDMVVQLQENLRQRDMFIVENALWDRFVKWVIRL